MSSQESAQGRSVPRALIVHEVVSAYLDDRFPFELLEFDFDKLGEHRAIRRAIGEVAHKGIEQDPALVERIGKLNEVLAKVHVDPLAGDSMVNTTGALHRL